MAHSNMNTPKKIDIKFTSIWGIFRSVDIPICGQQGWPLNLRLIVVNFNGY
jgi:hypothetical protein